MILTGEDTIMWQTGGAEPWLKSESSLEEQRVQEQKKHTKQGCPRNQAGNCPASHVAQQKEAKPNTAEILGSDPCPDNKF